MSQSSAIVVGAGASAGVGGACARRFAAEGLPVFVAARTTEKLEALVEEIARSGGTARAVPTDTTDPTAVANLFARAAETAPPRLVVYNAGNAHMGGLLDVEPEAFEQVWRVGCLGGFLVGREAARRVVGAGGGTLVFTGATASLRARPPFVAFASAKAALRSLAFGMAREFGPQGLHVAHAIIDGVVDGDMINSRAPQLKERLGEGGMLDPDAIAGAYWALHQQPASAWTLELDLRPAKESF